MTQWQKPCTIFAALLVLSLALQPLWVAPLLGRYLSHSSGRIVHLDSLQIGLSEGLQPVAKARGIYIQNSAWADSREPLAKIAEVRVVFAWSVLFKQQKLISQMQLVGAEIDMEKQADGLRNWRLLSPDDRRPGHYRVQSLELLHSKIRFVNRAYNLDVCIVASPGSQAEQGLPSRLNFSGSFLAIPFSGTADAGKSITLYDTGQLFALRGELKAGGATLNLSGEAGDLLAAHAIDADIYVAGSSLAAFSQLLGRRVTEPRKFKMTTHLKGSIQAYTATQLSMQFGTSDLSGHGSYAQRADNTLLRATLHSNVMDLADLKSLAGTPTKNEVKGTPRIRQSMAASPPFQFALSYQAAQLRMAGFAALQSLRLRANGREKLLAIPEFDVGVAGGHAMGQLEWDGNKTPPQLTSKMVWQGLQLQALLPAQKQDSHYSGVLKGQAHWQSSGATIAALTEALAGDASVVLSKGEISSLLDAEIGLQGGKILSSLLDGRQTLLINCANLGLVVRQGTASVHQLVFDTDHSQHIGTGSIDLPRQTLDLVLTSKASSPSWFVLKKSIRLHGPWRNLQPSLIDRVDISGITDSGCTL